MCLAQNTRMDAGTRKKRRTRRRRCNGTEKRPMLEKNRKNNNMRIAFGCSLLSYYMNLPPFCLAFHDHYRILDTTMSFPAARLETRIQEFTLPASGRPCGDAWLRGCSGGISGSWGCGACPPEGAGGAPVSRVRPSNDFPGGPLAGVPSLSREVKANRCWVAEL